MCSFFQKKNLCQAFKSCDTDSGWQDFVKSLFDVQETARLPATRAKQGNIAQSVLGSMFNDKQKKTVRLTLPATGTNKQESANGFGKNYRYSLPATSTTTTQEETANGFHPSDFDGNLYIYAHILRNIFL